MRRCEMQRRRFAIAGLARVPAQMGQATDQAGGAALELLTGRRQRRALGRAYEQRCADPILQRADPAAEGEAG